MNDLMSNEGIINGDKSCKSIKVPLDAITLHHFFASNIKYPSLKEHYSEVMSITCCQGMMNMRREHVVPTSNILRQERKAELKIRVMSTIRESDAGAELH